MIPYRVENSSDNFKREHRHGLRELLGLALVLKKGMEPYSFRDLEIDMKSFFDRSAAFRKRRVPWTRWGRGASST